MNTTFISYVPFQHENFDYKREIINIARKQDKTLQGILTSTLLFLNAIDYIAAHLLENLQMISHLITHEELNGIVFLSYPKQQTGISLGQTIKILENYDFPDKKNFIEELKEFNTIRIKYVHKLLSTTPEDLIDNIDKELTNLKQLAENLLKRYDTIVRGITESWFSYLKRNSSVLVPIEKLKEQSPIKKHEDDAKIK